MVLQETGEEMCLQNRVQGYDQAAAIADNAYNEHVEWRDVWLEQDEPRRMMAYGDYEEPWPSEW
jgi:fumarate hydratase class II